MARSLMKNTQFCDGGLDVQNSNAYRRAYRKEMQRFIAKQQLTHFLTLAFNGPTHFNSAERALCRFGARIDQSILGRDWLSRPQERTFFIAFPEHSLSNFHYHATVRFDCKDRPSLQELRRIVANTWGRIVPSGSAVLDRITSKLGISRYITKELGIHGHRERFVLSTQFQGVRRSGDDRETCANVGTGTDR